MGALSSEDMSSSSEKCVCSTGFIWSVQLLHKCLFGGYITMQSNHCTVSNDFHEMTATMISTSKHISMYNRPQCFFLLCRFCINYRKLCMFVHWPLIQKDSQWQP